MLLNSSPAVGFEQPFEMLEACHERVQRSLELLARLVEHLARAADTPRDREMAASAARDVLRYFDIAAPQHHEDEERHVFPAARERAEAAVVAAVERLQTDHRAMESAWAALRPLLEDVMRHGVSSQQGTLAAAARRFAALYDDHIALEESLVFPAARAAVEAAGGMAAMGDEMAARRGAPTPPRG